MRVLADSRPSSISSSFSLASTIQDKDIGSPFFKMPLHVLRGSYLSSRRPIDSVLEAFSEEASADPGDRCEGTGHLLWLKFVAGPWKAPEI